jgi:Phosphotransferase enzyme family
VVTQRDVTAYLIRRNLIESSSVVAGDLTILDVSRRNCNFKVISTHGPSYLIKQGMSPDGASTIAHEAAVYRLFHGRSEAQWAGIPRYLPKFYIYDEQERVLVLELISDAEDLYEHHTRTGRFAASIASMMGEGLAVLHGKSPAHILEESSFLPDRVPWVLGIHRPSIEMFRDVSEANLRLVKIVQQSLELCQTLDGLRESWSSKALIHHDIKWGNWLVLRPLRSRQEQRIKLVDWELAAPGDPCWDIGSVFSGYLGFWLSSIPTTGGEPPAKFLEHSLYPLDCMKLAIRSFWASYVQHMCLSTSDAGEWLLKSMRYAAARLVQMAFDELQVTNQMTGNMLGALQLSVNIATRPNEAALLLLGLPLHHRQIM